MIKLIFKETAHSFGKVFKCFFFIFEACVLARSNFCYFSR